MGLRSDRSRETRQIVSDSKRLAVLEEIIAKNFRKLTINTSHNVKKYFVLQRKKYKENHA